MTLPVFITPDSGIPIYLQIKHQVRYLIASRQLEEGVALPSVRALAGQLGITANTVSQAYRELITEGLIVTQQGRGAFVSTFSDMLPDSAYQRLQLLTSLLQDMRERAASLGFSTEDLRQHVTAALVQPVHMRLILIGPSRATTEKYQQILGDKLGGDVRVAGMTIDDVEASAKSVQDAFGVAYYALTFPTLVRRLELTLNDHHIPAEIIPITAELTAQSLRGLSRLQAEDAVYLVTEERNIATALNIVLQNSSLAYESIMGLAPSGELGAKLRSSDDLVIHTFGVRETLDELGIPLSRRYELTFDVSDQALRAIRNRLGLRSAVT